MDPTEWSDLEKRLDSIPYPGNFLIPEAGSDYYTYAGEIPWASTFAPDYPDGGPEDDGATSSISFRGGPSFPIEILSHTYQWESYHSVLNQAGGALVPARPFCEFYELRNRPQTFDLFLPDGTKAAFSVGAPGGVDRGHVLYLREALVRQYAEAKGLELAWLIWGERQIVRDSFSRDDRLTPVYAAHQNVHRRVTSLRQMVAEGTQTDAGDTA